MRREQCLLKFEELNCRPGREVWLAMLDGAYHLDLPSVEHIDAASP